MREEMRMQEEARKIQKRAHIRLEMLERAARSSSHNSSTGDRTEKGSGASTALSDYLNDPEQLKNDILDQPSSISWKLRLLYRVGRSFSDAAVGFNYSGYRIRFVLKDSPMLRAVLAGFETLIREQYLHVRRSRLANHHARTHQVTCGTAVCEKPDIPSIRAVSVVVECDSVLDLERQIMWCTVMRARQDKLDPNCLLTITRTLNVMRDPVHSSALIECLSDAKDQHEPE